jgi:hypothetical protein
VSLFGRIIGTDSDPDGGPPKLSVSFFASGMFEFAQGEFTKAAIVNYLGLDAAEEAELDALISLYNAQPNAAARNLLLDVLRVSLELGEQETPGYATSAQIWDRLNRV